MLAVPASGQNVEGMAKKQRACLTQRREGPRAVQCTRSGATQWANSSSKEPNHQVRNLRRVHSSRCSQARRRVFRVAGIPCQERELAWCLASGNVVSEIQRPALVRWGHGHSTIAITALVLRTRIVVVLLLRLLLLAVHRCVRRMRVVLTLRLSVLLGALSLRRLVRACKDRRLRVRRTVASVLRHLRRCKGRWLILRVGRSRESANLAAVPSVGLEGIDLRAGVTG